MDVIEAAQQELQSGTGELGLYPQGWLAWCGRALGAQEPHQT